MQFWVIIVSAFAAVAMACDAVDCAVVSKGLSHCVNDKCVPK